MDVTKFLNLSPNLCMIAESELDVIAACSVAVDVPVTPFVYSSSKPMFSSKIVPDVIFSTIKSIVGAWINLTDWP